MSSGVSCLQQPVVMMVLYHVALEITHLAEFQDAVLAHCRCAHQFRAGKVIIGVSDNRPQVLNDTTLHRLVDAVAEIACVRMAETPSDSEPGYSHVSRPTPAARRRARAR